MSDSDKTQTILFVGIAERDGLSLDKILLNSNWRAHRAGNCQGGLEFLDQHHVSVVLSDSQLPDGSWRELLDGMASLSVPPNLIVSSRLADDRLWAEVLSLGGFDVLMTPFDIEEVLWVTSAAWRDWECKKLERPPEKRGLRSAECIRTEIVQCRPDQRAATLGDRIPVSKQHDSNSAAWRLK